MELEKAETERHGLVFSKFCAGNGACVEFAFTPDGRVALIQTGRPDEVLYWLKADWDEVTGRIKAGELDDVPAGHAVSLFQS